MDMNGRKYIAYGSNLNREQMAKRCPDAKVIGSGMLKDYCFFCRRNEGRVGGKGSCCTFLHL